MLPMKETVRLNKFISQCGFTSRRKSEEYIKEARVTLNGKVIYDLSIKIDPSSDEVCIDGEKLHPQKKVYYLLNKPKGFITSTDDEKNRKTVISLIKTNIKIFPVGRLDFNTTGTLLLTNDGEFANFLTHPKNKISRQYKVQLDKPLTKEDKIILLKRIILDKRRSKFTKISFPINRNYKIVNVETVEGRNHFVKNMFARLNYKVISLHRNSFGGISANNIALGHFVKLSYTEINYLYKKYG